MRKDKKVSKKTINTISWIGIGVTGLALFGLSVYVRFANVDATETRLFLLYWKEYVIGMIVFVIFGALYKWSAE